MRFRPANSNKLLTVLALAAALAACAKDSPTSPPTTLAFGEWGADDAQVIASDSVTHVWLQCTSGDFAGSVVLDAEGRFSVNGTYDPYVLPIAPPDGPMPAQLSGQVAGNTLTFAIAVNDTIGHQVISLGPRTVVLGQQANIVVCPD
ncbi:MAG: hypothetical protein ACREN6_10725 [Gemmatimonadaceae bacterium]